MRVQRTRPVRPLPAAPGGLHGLFDDVGTLAIATLADRDLFPIHGHVARRFDPNPNLGPIHRHDRDFDVITDA
jgi:hypothetical protein